MKIITISILLSILFSAQAHAKYFLDTGASEVSKNPLTYPHRIVGQLIVGKNKIFNGTVTLIGETGALAVAHQLDNGKRKINKDPMWVRFLVEKVVNGETVIEHVDYPIDSIRHNNVTERDLVDNFIDPEKAPIKISLRVPPGEPVPGKLLGHAEIAFNDVPFTKPANLGTMKDRFKIKDEIAKKILSKCKIQNSPLKDFLDEDESSAEDDQTNWFDPSLNKNSLCMSSYDAHFNGKQLLTSGQFGGMFEGLFKHNFRTTDKDGSSGGPIYGLLPNGGMRIEAINEGSVCTAEGITSCKSHDPENATEFNHGNFNTAAPVQSLKDADSWPEYSPGRERK